MDVSLLKATQVFIKKFKHVESVQDLKTKVRINLAQRHILDLYYNATFGKYSYTLIKNDKRILGWDNAPHHPDVKSHPHHFHLQNTVLESKMKGKPDKDINLVIKEINKLYEK